MGTRGSSIPLSVIPALIRHCGKSFYHIWLRDEWGAASSRVFGQETCMRDRHAMSLTCTFHQAKQPQPLP